MLGCYPRMFFGIIKHASWYKYNAYLSTLRNLKQGDFIWFRVHSLRRGVRGPPRPPKAQGFQVFSEGIPAVSWYIH